MSFWYEMFYPPSKYEYTDKGAKVCVCEHTKNEHVITCLGGNFCRCCKFTHARKVKNA